MKSLIVTFLRYSLVGLLVACLDLSMYTLLFAGMGVWYLYAHTLSRAVGGATGFVLNRRWSFGWRSRAELPAHLVKFAVIYLLSYAASAWLLYAFVERFRVPAVPAKMSAEAIVFLFNFLTLRQWAFRRRLGLGQQPVGILTVGPYNRQGRIEVG